MPRGRRSAGRLEGKYQESCCIQAAGSSEMCRRQLKAGVWRSGESLVTDSQAVPKVSCQLSSLGSEGPGKSGRTPEPGGPPPPHPQGDCRDTQGHTGTWGTGHRGQRKQASCSEDPSSDHRGIAWKGPRPWCPRNSPGPALSASSIESSPRIVTIEHRLHAETSSMGQPYNPVRLPDLSNLNTYFPSRLYLCLIGEEMVCRQGGQAPHDHTASQCSSRNRPAFRAMRQGRKCGGNQRLLSTSCKHLLHTERSPSVLATDEGGPRTLIHRWINGGSEIQTTCPRSRLVSGVARPANQAV